MQFPCVCFEWFLLSKEKCQSRVYALNDFSIDRKNVSLVCMIWMILSIDRKNVSLVCMLWMIFLSIETMSVSCVSFIDGNMWVSCDFSVSKQMPFCVYVLNGFLSIEKCQSRVYALNVFFLSIGKMSVSCVSSIDRKMWVSCHFSYR